jgi:hypothetical protein
VRGFPAMDAGERAYARLTGSDRARGFPAMRDARTAGELTGGAWHRKPQNWALELDSSRPRIGTTAVTASSDDLRKAQSFATEKTSQGFSLGSQGVAAAAAPGELTDETHGLYTPSVLPGPPPLDTAGATPSPTEYSAAPPPPAVVIQPEPIEPGDWGGDSGFSLAPSEASGSAPLPEHKGSSTPSSTSSSTNSAGSVLTIGALLAAVFFT